MSSIEDYSLAKNHFIFGEPDQFFEPLILLQQQDSQLRAPLDAFWQNLASALMVGSIPFQLAHASVLDLRFGQILTAERIRARKFVEPGESLDEANEQAARSTAKQRWAEEVKDQSIVQLHARDTLRRLESHITEPEFFASCQELLRQVLVMSWGAFETIANDLVRLLLNLKPDLVCEVWQARPYKDLLTARTLLGGLEGAGFNLSDRMGDFLSDLASLDSLEKIRAAARALFHSEKLETDLKDTRLWRIEQQRHLIVHRRGVVDVRYRDRTGDATEVGEKLIFNADYVEASMSLVRNAGCLMYEAACARLSTVEYVLGSPASARRG